MVLLLIHVLTIKIFLVSCFVCVDGFFFLLLFSPSPYVKDPHTHTHTHKIETEPLYDILCCLFVACFIYLFIYLFATRLNCSSFSLYRCGSSTVDCGAVSAAGVESVVGANYRTLLTTT